MPDEFRLTSEDLEPPKKDRKKVIIISAAVAVVLLLGILGYLGWKKYAEKQNNLKTLQEQLENLKKATEDTASQLTGQNNSTTEESASEETVADEYAGWNTYTNTQVGYELKYPADWTVKETDTFNDLIGNDVKYITITTADKKYFLYWGLKYDGDDFAISDRTGVGAGDLIQEGTVTILGTNTAIKKLVYKNKVKEYFYPGTGSQKTTDGKYYFGAAMSPGSGSGYDSLDMLGVPELEKARLILASVKIIPRAAAVETGCASTLTASDKVAIKNWKTFKNDKYDYSFRYPEDWDYDKVSDKLIDFEGDDNVVFSWRSEEMTALGFEGWDTDGAQKNLKVACQSAKSTFLKQGDERMIFTQFKKDGKNHMTNFGYRYVGASISSDMVEMYDLVLKSVEFD
jgi:hypothetical protein